MSYFIQSFSPWKTRRASTRNDDAEFGLDLPSSHGLAISDKELSECYAERSELFAYGTLSDNTRYEKVASIADTGGKLYAGLHQVLAFAAGTLVVFVFCHRMMHYAEASKAFARAGSPSIAAGIGLQPPKCAAYEYPQCEAAIQSHLSRNARNRCHAFEMVKAEGDFFKFPYSTERQEMCDASQPGCCGCAGQCSKCPPLLAECFSWRLDGSWPVAFDDGSESKYMFDAHGHCEFELSSRSLPVAWKSYDQVYITQGSDIMQQWLSVDEAQRLCRSEPQCKGFTYDESSLTEGKFFVSLKSKASLSAASGTGWKSHVQEERPIPYGEAVVVAPLTQISSDPPNTFRLDLHKAAPQLFPAGSTEQLTVTGDELSS